MARYFRRGKTQIFFVPTITSIAAPTATEINAGTEITASVAEVAGFSFTNQPIDVPDMASPWVSKIPGEDQADDSSLTFYDDTTSNPLRTTLAKGTEGYIVIAPAGGTGAITTADKVDIYPVQVAGIPREYSAGNDPARWRAEFTVTNPPQVDLSVA